MRNVKARHWISMLTLLLLHAAGVLLWHVPPAFAVLACLLALAILVTTVAGSGGAVQEVVGMAGMAPVLAGVGEVGVTQGAKIGGELDNVSRLLGDAIQQIMSSFNAIAGLAVRQQEIAANLAIVHRSGTSQGPHHELDSLVPELQQIAGEVRSNSNRAVTAMQFQDLVTQSLSHTQARIAQLLPLFDLLRHWPDMAAGDAAAHAHINDLSRALQRAGSRLAEADQRHPVAQQTMASNDVELF